MEGTKKKDNKSWGMTLTPNHHPWKKQCKAKKKKEENVQQEILQQAEPEVWGEPGSYAAVFGVDVKQVCWWWTEGSHAHLGTLEKWSQVNKKNGTTDT